MIPKTPRLHSLIYPTFTQQVLYSFHQLRSLSIVALLNNDPTLTQQYLSCGILPALYTLFLRNDDPVVLVCICSYILSFCISQRVSFQLLTQLSQDLHFDRSQIKSDFLRIFFGIIVCFLFLFLTFSFHGVGVSISFPVGIKCSSF